MEQIRVLGYARVSTKEQARGENLETQTIRLNEWINNPEGKHIGKSLKFIGGYKDKGKTGTSEKGRKIKQIMKDAEDDKFDILIFTKWDRLYRNNYARIGFLRKLVELKKEFWATNESNDKITREILGVLAEDESSKISERIADGYMKNIKKGKFCKNLKGYRKTKTKKVRIHKYWGPRIQEMISRYVKGDSLKCILNDVHISRASFIGIIHNQSYTSYVSFKDIKTPIQYEPLFSEKERLECCLRYYKELKYKVGMSEEDFIKFKTEKIKEFEEEIEKLNN
ncbi:MAG: recombinase family protein [Candidatus Pacearchaeota archaeon]|nr:recombinase family protein [Candidatus Pacearchaeota archaeon]